MLKDSKKVFEMYVKENGFSDNKIAVIEGVYKKLSRWEITAGKNIKKATKKELINLCQTGNTKIANRSYGALKTRVDAINDILKWLRTDTKLSMTDFNTEEILVDNKIRYFTKEEMQDICDLFINPQDKFIVYGMFMGILGKAYSDLLNLTVNDIDMDNKIIKTPSGKIIEMDEYLLDIVEDVIDPVYGATYYKYMKDETEGSTTGDYKLNMSCKYIIKPKPYSKNNDGLDPMKVNGIQRRLLKLSEVLSSENFQVSLSGTDIYRSGVMYRMHLIEESTKASWTCASLETWLKDNGIKAQPFELYRLYNNKYKKVEKQPVN